MQVLSTNVDRMTKLMDKILDKVSGKSFDMDDIKLNAFYTFAEIERNGWRSRTQLTEDRKAGKLKVNPNKPTQVQGKDLLTYLKGRNNVFS